MKRIFVFEYLTGGGAAAAYELLPLGLAMRDAMVADLLADGACEVSVAVSAQAPAAAAAAAGVCPLTASAGEDVLDFVAREAARHDAVWLVAPETGGLLATLRRRVGPARWLGCSAAAIALATSKRATLRHLAAHGVATALDFELSATRWVVKPDDGAGGVDTRCHANRAAALADQRARQNGASTLEPWVDGTPLSLSLLCRAGDAELLAINRQRVDVDADGRLRYRGVDVAACPVRSARGHALASLARRVASVIDGLQGYVGIDLVWHAARGPVLIEVNPRVTCAYVGLSAVLGRNLAHDVLAAHAWEPCDATA